MLITSLVSSNSSYEYEQISKGVFFWLYGDALESSISVCLYARELAPVHFNMQVPERGGNDVINCHNMDDVMCRFACV